MGVLAAIVIENDRRIIARRREMVMKRMLRDLSNPFIIGDDVFRQHYRMFPHLAIEFLTLIVHRLPMHPDGVPPYLQFLSVVRFLADGSYQRGLGRDMYHPISQSSVSRYIHHVIPAINSVSGLFIRFPNTPEERNAVQQRFQERIGFPGVLGAVDCTLLKIIAPHDHEEAYINYKRYHSLTLQIIADLDYIILDTRICSGSTNDRFVWRWSRIREYLYHLRNDIRILREEGHFYIIGDGGYSPSRILLTPIQRAIPGTPDYAFSDALRRSRVFVENTFGILKAKWRCLCSLRGLHYEPIFAAQIVQACTVLHNFLRRNEMPVPVLPNDAQGLIRIATHQGGNIFREEGRQEYFLGIFERQRIINTFF